MYLFANTKISAGCNEQWKSVRDEDTTLKKRVSDGEESISAVRSNFTDKRHHGSFAKNPKGYFSKLY
ncbi:hypothetical protein ACROYT_G007275 [Oculina patagonica]